MTMFGLYLAIEVVILYLWPSDSSAIRAVLPLVIAGFVLKVAGAWFGAGGATARAPAKTA